MVPVPVKYDVALSFAGEERVHAEALAERLRAAGVRVFYDAYEKAELWGKNLYEHLHNVYSEQAKYCVVFVSKHYAAKIWTTHEHRAAQERVLKERGEEYILPLQFDDTVLPGTYAIGHVHIREGIDRVAHLLLEKLGVAATAATPTASTVPIPTSGHRGQVSKSLGGLQLTLEWRTRKHDRDASGEVVRHQYELVASLANVTPKRLNDWYMEIEMPTPLLYPPPGTIYAARVANRSDARRTVLRTSNKLPPILSGDTNTWIVTYRVDKDLFYNQRSSVLSATATAKAFVDGDLVLEVTLPKIKDF